MICLSKTENTRSATYIRSQIDNLIYRNIKIERPVKQVGVHVVFEVAKSGLALALSH